MSEEGRYFVIEGVGRDADARLNLMVSNTKARQVCRGKLEDLEAIAEGMNRARGETAAGVHTTEQEPPRAKADVEERSETVTTTMDPAQVELDGRSEPTELHSEHRSGSEYLEGKLVRAHGIPSNGILRDGVIHPLPKSLGFYQGDATAAVRQVLGEERRRGY